MLKSASKSRSHTVSHLLLTMVAVTLILIVVFPQLFVDGNYSFIRFADTEFLYFGAFQYAQNLSNGGFALWNNYDQMPLAYYYVSGLLTYTNFIIAAAYTVLDGWTNDAGELFYNIFRIGNAAAPTIVRILGFFLLGTLFSKSRFVLFFASVVAGTCLTPHLQYGLNCTSIYSLLPLLTFFLARFATRLKLVDLLSAIVVVSLAIAFDPLVAAGYFFQPVHFLCLSIIFWWLLTPNGRIRIKLLKFKSPSRASIRLSVGTALLFLLLVVPNAILLGEFYSEYELAHGTSRFSKIFSITEYFERKHFGASPENFFFNSLAFFQNEWIYQWVFIGWISIGMSFLGALYSKDSRKLIFLSTVVLLWFIQFPRDPDALWNLGHWLTALTNPLNSVLRTAHMSGGFLGPLLLFPLLVLGLDLCTTVSGRQTLQNSPLAKHLFAISVIGFIAVSSFQNSHELVPPGTSLLWIFYLFGGAFGFVLVLVIRSSNFFGGMHGAWMSSCVLLSLFALDLNGLRIYNATVAENMRIHEHKIEELPEGLNQLLLDYQAPGPLRLKEFLKTQEFSGVDPYFTTNPNNMQGVFYQFTDLNKFHREPHNYKPRHKEYISLFKDDIFKKYFAANQQTSFFVNHAIRGGRDELVQILQQGLINDVVILDDVPPLALANSRTSNQKPQSQRRFVEGKDTIEIRLDIEDASQKAKRSNWMEITWNVRNLLPPSLASTPFTNDAFILNITAAGKKLTPVQGSITGPDQFDLNNSKLNRLTIALTGDVSVNSLSEVVLRYQPVAPVNPFSLTTQKTDSWTANLEIDEDGWLVLHIPYDKKWRATVNGAEVETKRANLLFLAIPMQSGLNTLELAYMPNSFLRWLMPANIVLALATLIGIFTFAYTSHKHSSVRRRNE